MKWKVEIYDSGSNSLEYEIDFPFHEQVGMVNDVRDAEGNGGGSIGFPAVDIKVANDYVVTTAFYSPSVEYSEYMIGFTLPYGHK